MIGFPEVWDGDWDWDKEGEEIAGVGKRGAGGKKQW